ncbi:phosphodiesterase [Sphingomonas deserti]|uniref:Phosphodiesterase n=2 Tax=Allosphingosinicella deserti TaxID=2116704 RepID=A0A2P7QSQ4_9SPHN|nr:phosphodiesterase [Sphingomonas deserti]
MFIESFDGSWFRHPFWKSRFVIASAEQLAAVLDSDIPGLVIDTSRGSDVAGAATPAPSHGAEVAGIAPAGVGAAPSRAAPPPMPVAPPNPSRAEERARAEAAAVVSRSKKVVRGIFDGARLGKAIESEAVVAVVEDISATIEKNRAAFLKVVRLKSKDEYTYLHSVAVCALMVSFARQLDLNDRVTSELGTAGLLHDIGKTAVPSDVLNKPARLSAEEYALVQTHPEQGYRLLVEATGVPELALDVCRHHHEKVDGTGYPHGLTGAEISLAARMGAICDVYDALTSNRAYKRAWSPVQAITEMAGWHGQFDPDLLFTFMQSIGVFPVGMVVRLRSNRLGVVLDPGRRASTARVLAFYSIARNSAIAPEAIILADGAYGDAVVAKADPAHWGAAASEAAALYVPSNRAAA